MARRRLGGAAWRPCGTLLCCQGRVRRESVVEVAGERTLDAAPGFAVGLAGAKQSLVVGSRLTIVADAGERDHVQGAIQLPVAAAVEAMTPLAPARGIDRAGAGERRKGGLAPHAGGIAPRGDPLRRADGTKPAPGQQI